nr:MAG TPA: hypothetical protein [Caudoviricetes sp.]
MIFFKKSLDIFVRLWYHIITERETNSFLEYRKRGFNHV